MSTPSFFVKASQAKFPKLVSKELSGMVEITVNFPISSLSASFNFALLSFH